MTPSSPKTCLITGALGFLGRHAASEFARSGYRVIGLGREAALPGAVPGELAEYTSMELPGPELDALLEANKPQVIVHTAGPASVAASMSDPAADFAGTVDVVLALLDAVRRVTPDSRVAVVSSAAVYGNPRALPVAEDASLAPVSPYGFHKQIAETMLAEYSAVYGLKTCAARVFSAYGAGLRRQILWDVCEKAAAGSPVRLFGTGDETRDFVHAADVAQALRVLVEGAPMCGDVYNVASGVETSIRELADRLVQAVAPGTQVEFSGAARPGDPERWLADTSRIRSLGYAPTVKLLDGIEEYARWYLESGRAR